MREAITISLSPILKKRLDGAVKRTQLNRSGIVREALRRYFSVEEFEQIRREMIPLAEEKGIYTEEDVFKRVS